MARAVVEALEVAAELAEAVAAASAMLGSASGVARATTWEPQGGRHSNCSGREARSHCPAAQIPPAGCGRTCRKSPRLVPTDCQSEAAEEGPLGVGLELEATAKPETFAHHEDLPLPHQ